MLVHNQATPTTSEQPKRRRRSAQLPGLTIGELCRLTRVSPRTIADYVKRGLLTAPEFRASATRYPRDHLLRVVAIQWLKSDGIKRLKEIHTTLQTMGNHELEAWLKTKQLRDDVVQALGFERSPSAPLPTHAHTSADKPAITGAEAWQHLRLLPGLELSWQTETAPFAQHIAEYFRAYLQRVTQNAG